LSQQCKLRDETSQAGWQAVVPAVAALAELLDNQLAVKS